MTTTSDDSKYAGTDSEVFIELFDSQTSCSTNVTTGLDNSGIDDLEKGATDTFEGTCRNGTCLGGCKDFRIGTLIRVTIKLGNGDTDGWLPENIKIETADPVLYYLCANTEKKWVDKDLNLTLDCKTGNLVSFVE